MSARKVLTWYAAGMGVLVGCFFAVPAMRTALFLLVGVVSGVMFVLVLSRLADAADAHRLAVTRERSLRKAGADLVSATAAREVDGAVRAAVARLVPKHASHRVVFTVNRADGVPAAATSIWGPAVAAPSAYYPAPSAATARQTRILRVGSLQPALAEQLGQFKTAVLCPLVLDERATGVPRVGALLVAADAAVLAGLRDSLEVLAAQVALALERIGLNQEISRRDSEAYFRSVVQNATDVILVVDDDRSIRYASPSVRTVHRRRAGGLHRAELGGAPGRPGTARRPAGPGPNRGGGVGRLDRTTSGR